MSHCTCGPGSLVTNVDLSRNLRRPVALRNGLPNDMRSPKDASLVEGREPSILYALFGKHPIPRRGSIHGVEVLTGGNQIWGGDLNIWHQDRIARCASNKRRDEESQDEIAHIVSYVAQRRSSGDGQKRSFCPSDCSVVMDVFPLAFVISRSRFRRE